MQTTIIQLLKNSFFTLWEQGVPGSNLGTPERNKRLIIRCLIHASKRFFVLLFLR